MKKLILLIGITCLPLSVFYGMNCLICQRRGKTFSCNKRSTMVLHLARKHELGWCPCCPTFIRIDQFVKHVADKHNRRVCSFCLMITFENNEEYQLHKDTVHFAFSKYPCLICKEGFPTSERFLIHMFVKHKFYTCLQCAKTNRIREEFEKDRIQTEFDKENSENSIIGIFEKDNKYVAHMIYPHRDYVCLVCNMQTFNTLRDYNAHCSFCNECCLHPNAIQVHCKHCGRTKKFRNKAEQNLHELQHAFLLFFLQQTICGHDCCVLFQKAVVRVFVKWDLWFPLLKVKTIFFTQKLKLKM